jgi:ureidoacrylate peracid hydrolase|uniref:Cysteine hydrolase n=1 Tax=candidate division WOR-3 bacterium TaxID=2052148 RepID=A0A7C3YRM1_UNCW3
MPEIKRLLEAIAPFNRHKMKLIPKRSCLLIIDMQNDFLNPGSEIYLPEGERIIPNIKKLLSAFRKRRLPVIYTAHCHKDPKIDGGMTAEWWPELKAGKVLKAETKGVEIHPALRPKKELVIYKNRYSAFYNTNLEICLRGLKVTDLVITGVMTNICCESTARDAFFRDFRIFFPMDATASSEPELHLATLKNLSYAFAYVTTTKEILQQIRLTKILFSL